MSQSGRVARPVAAFLAVTALQSAAVAHGVPPAIVEVVAVAASGQPRVVTLTEGLAQLSGDSFRYVCPVQFGNELSPPALSLDGEHTTVVGQRDLFILGPDGSTTARGLPELSRSTVIRIAATRQDLFVLRSSGGTSSVVRIDEADYSEVWSDVALLQSLDAGPEHLWVGGTREARAVLRKLSPRGEVLDERQFDVEPGEWVGHVVSVGSDVYATLVASRGARLIRLGPYDAGAEVALEAPTTIFGAVVTGPSSGWVAAGGVLYSVGAGEPLPISHPALATGLSDTGGHSFLLSSLRVFALQGTGVGAALLDLRTLKPPPLELVRPELREACGAEWAVFEGDLRRMTRPEGDASFAAAPDGGPPVTEARKASGGCAVRSRTGDRGGLAATSWALLGLCAARRRGRAGRAAGRGQVDRG